MTAPHLHTMTLLECPVAGQEQFLQLRARYRQDRDVFSSQELARLRFLRWLYQTRKGSESR